MGAVQVTKSWQSFDEFFSAELGKLGWTYKMDGNYGEACADLFIWETRTYKIFGYAFTRRRTRKIGYFRDVPFAKYFNGRELDIVVFEGSAVEPLLAIAERFEEQFSMPVHVRH